MTPAGGPPRQVTAWLSRSFLDWLIDEAADLSKWSARRRPSPELTQRQFDTMTDAMQEASDRTPDKAGEALRNGLIEFRRAWDCARVEHGRSPRARTTS